MKNKKMYTIFSLFGMILCGYVAFGQQADLEKYNVIWDSPGDNSSGSMPIGNGDIGVNPWIEKNGDLVFYLSKTDAWDENGRLCKVGKVRITFDPALSAADNFRQELNLSKGVIIINSKIGDRPSTIRLWVDAKNPVVHIEAESEVPAVCHAKVELWRLHERPFGKDDDSFSGRGIFESEFKPTVLPDEVINSIVPRVVWLHCNTSSIYDLGLKVQHLETLKGQTSDPLLGLTFGASMSGEGFVSDGNLALKSSANSNLHNLSVNVLTTRTGSKNGWLTQMDQLTQKNRNQTLNKLRQAHESWWTEFWDRSWIYVDGVLEAQNVTSGYVLQRFMNACSGRGGSPIKFNGSIFTLESQKKDLNGERIVNPDWRRWGSNYWFQNTRLIYWPMLASGDFEMIDPLFRMYSEALPLSLARIKTYYGFDHAAGFPETMYWWGLPNNGDYGWQNTSPELETSFIKHHWNGNLELILLMLNRYEYTQDQVFAKRVLLTLADPLISFFDQYWPKRDTNRKIIFDHSQALEAWWDVVNPMPDIAGLRSVLPRLLALPNNLITSDQRLRWTRILQELPPIPMADVKGVKLLRPAEIFSKGPHTENPELYAIFPFRLYGVGMPDLTMARQTFGQRTNHHNRGWCQDGIQAACLGLRDEAARLVSIRAANINKTARFPALWGPNFDWVPDQDHGNNILTALQFMLVQPVGDKIFLMPSWPKTWDVKFKLHAPKKTVIEGEYHNGKLSYLKVTPKSRTKDVVKMLPM